MLAAAGFSVVGIFFGIFAYTFDSMVARRSHAKLGQFAYAYYSLALAFFVWGAASAVASHDVLQWSVIAGDGLLLLATFFLLDIVIGANYRRLWIAPAVLVSVALIYLRIKFYFPAPYMTEGVLVFNTQPLVATVLSLVFVLTWLPVNAWVARVVTHKSGLDSLMFSYLVIYSAATVGVVFFLFAHRPIIVVLSFLAIAVCFVMLIASNLLVRSIGRRDGFH